MMKEYKKSKYNYWYKQSGKQYLYNTISQKLVELSAENATLFTKLPENHIEIRPSDYSWAIENGYLIENWVDEFSYIQYKEYEKVYSKDELFIMVLPTDGCNFNCVYCPQNTKTDSMGDTIKQKLITFVQEESREYKHIRINWFGGEPLLEKQSIVDIMHSLKQNPKIKVPIIGDITTNGYLLDLKTFQELITQTSHLNKCLCTLKIQ